MKYVKRLVILSGERGKGTLNLERNAYGVFGKLNAFGSNLNSLDLVMKIDGKIFTRSVMDKAGFDLEGQESVETVQAAVFENGRLIMFGTNESRRLLASEAERLGTYIKKENKPLFSGRGETEGKIIKLSYGQRLDSVAEENMRRNPEDSAEKPDYPPETNAEITLEYLPESKTDIKVETAYEDERIAGENFYPEPDCDIAVTAAEERVRSIMMKTERFLHEYEVSPADLERAFLTGKAAAKTEPIQKEINPQPPQKVIPTQDREVKPPQNEFMIKPPQNDVVQRQENKEPAVRPLIKYRRRQTHKKVLSIFGKDERDEKLRMQPGSGRTGGESFFGLEQSEGYLEAAAEKSAALRSPDNFRRGEAIKKQDDFSRIENKSLNNMKNLKYAASSASDKNDDKKNDRNSSAAAKKDDPQKTTAQRVSAVDSGRHVNAREGTFFERNGEEIEKLFKGPREQTLEKLLPGSRWVKINYDNSGRFYVIGLIGKEFLCYGVPADFSPKPPEELKGYCWWLPLTPDKPEGRGYWIMYQNLITGETVYPK